MEKKFNNKKGQNSRLGKREESKESGYKRSSSGTFNKSGFRKPKDEAGSEGGNKSFKPKREYKPKDKEYSKSYGDNKFSDKPFEEKKRRRIGDTSSSFGENKFGKDKPQRERKYGKEEGKDSYKPREGSGYKGKFNEGSSSFRKAQDRPLTFEELGSGDKTPKKFERKTWKKSPSTSRTDKPLKPREKKIDVPSYDFRKFKQIEADLEDKARQGKNKGKKTALPSVEQSESLPRLNRYIANAGVCSRREADVLIAEGRIKINGKVMQEMGYKVKPTDSISLDGEVLKREKIVYVLLNKPKDHITTTEDPEGRKTVMNLVKKACDERIYPVGRLDRNTTGLLLLTNDGKLAEKLAHPSNNIKKVYHVYLTVPIREEDLDKLIDGIELEDGFIKADKIAVASEDAIVVEVHIHSGKNRIVRRMFEHIGYEVEKLDRVAYAGLTKKGLARGEWRYLSEQEVIRLKYFVK